MNIIPLFAHLITLEVRWPGFPHASLCCPPPDVNGRTKQAYFSVRSPLRSTAFARLLSWPSPDLKTSPSSSIKLMVGRACDSQYLYDSLKHPLVRFSDLPGSPKIPEEVRHIPMLFNSKASYLTVIPALIYDGSLWK